MDSIKKNKSNYSIFLLSLLFVEFISFFLRANSLPNLGVMMRAVIFIYIIVNFALVLLTQLLNGRKNPKIISSAILFWAYSMLIYFINNQLDVFELINLTSWISVLYLFYYYGFPKSIKLLTLVSSVFVCIFILLYYRYAIVGGFVGDKPGVVNSIYYLVLSISFITLIDNKVPRNIMLVLISVITLVSLKGTAIIIVFIALLINYLFIKKNANRKNILLIFGGSLAFIVVWMIVSSVSNVGIVEILNSNIESGGNGRFEIWEEIFKAFNQGPLLNKLFGYGLNFSVNITEYSAHCDYIEILSAFGIVGFILFFRWFYCIAKEIFANAKQETYFSSICFMVLSQISLIMMFSTTMFISNYFLISMAISGMVFNEMLRENNERINKESHRRVLK